MRPELHTLTLRPLFVAALLLVVALPGCQKDPSPAPEKAEEHTTPETAAGEKGPTPQPATPLPGGSETPPEAAGNPAAPTEIEQATPRQKELLQGGMSQLGIGETDMAVMHLLALVDEGPASAEKLIGYVLLAEVYKMEGTPTKGIERLQGAMGSFPPNVEMPLALAELQEAADKIDDALVSLDKALGLGPERLDLLARRVHMVVDAKRDPSDANATYDAALEKTIAAMGDANTPKPTLLELIGPLGTVRDPRLIAPMVNLLGHRDLDVVAASAEAIVNAGAVDALEGMRARRAIESREEIANGLDAAIAYLEQIEDVPQVLDMPYLPAEGAPAEAN